MNQTASVFAKEMAKQAISDGKALIKEGKTKIQTVTAMFATLKGTDRE